MTRKRSKTAGTSARQMDSTAELRTIFADAIESAQARPLTSAEKLRAARLRRLAHEAVEDLVNGIFGDTPKIARGELALLKRGARLLLGITKAGEICFAIAAYVEVVGTELERDSTVPHEQHLHRYLRRIAPLVDHFWSLLRLPLSGARETPLELLHRAVRLRAKRNKRWLLETHRAMTAMSLYEGDALSFEKGFYRYKSKPIGPRNVAD